MAAVAACGSGERQYDAEVAGFEPIYCYQTIGRPTCYDRPDVRDERGLVNFYGPAPKAYERPPPPPQADLVAPPARNYHVRDAEPFPEPSPRGSLRDRPWLLPDPETDDAMLDPLDRKPDEAAASALPAAVETGSGVAAVPPPWTETAPIE